MMRHLKLVLLFLMLGCQSVADGTSEQEFRLLMQNIAEGWSTQNTDLALSSFADDAIYMEPPDIQYYRGHDQLRPYFEELDNGYKMEFHNLWFSTENQSGAAEYTFSYGKDTSDVGVVVVELDKGKIKFWWSTRGRDLPTFRIFSVSRRKISSGTSVIILNRKIECLAYKSLRLLTFRLKGILPTTEDMLFGVRISCLRSA